MTSLDLTFSPIAFIGSFQCGRRIPSENPRADAWKAIAKIGTIEESKRICSQNRVPRDRPPLVSVRIRQSVELRQAARNASLLTAPLLYYYSFQNLARAFINMAIKEEVKSSHGADFFSATGSIINSKAIVTRSGTIPAFAKLFGSSLTNNYDITLGQAICSIPEIAASKLFGSRRLASVRISAYMSNGTPTTAKFYFNGMTPEEIDVNFAAMFPKLSAITIKTESPATYKFSETIGSAYSDIGNFLIKHFIPDLRFRDDAVWYCLRSDDNLPNLPRPVYYLIAMYILSNAVRYEPKLIASLDPDSTELGWSLREFLDLADRHFPQLLLSVGADHPIHYG
jgi:hypothetical protein